jgi:hypothetical protein
VIADPSDRSVDIDIRRQLPIRDPIGSDLICCRIDRDDSPGVARVWEVRGLRPRLWSRDRPDAAVLEYQFGSPFQWDLRHHPAGPDIEARYEVVTNAPQTSVAECLDIRSHSPRRGHSIERLFSRMLLLSSWG